MKLEMCCGDIRRRVLKMILVVIIAIIDIYI